ncbi:zinc finger MYM-type protein 1-like [Hydra vulgaris]|uniref:zinc finger MYM-type protein 1-like n=1 Tax=Hydra vulgaris TaxID=6087 RepID=UPI0032E9E4FE
MELIGHYDFILNDHLEKVKASQQSHMRMQAHYLSNDIQNEFIQCCADKVTDVILDEREKCKYFSMIVDATPDTAHIEQNVFILRYDLQDKLTGKYEVKERFLEFVDCNKKTGEDIANIITSTLQKHKIPLMCCRGQGYDNGSNMKGSVKGAQARVLQHYPLATYSPCACHSLNLCGAQAAECCPQVITFFGIVQKLYNIFSSSPQRWEILKKYIGSSFHSMSQTRWSARVDSIKPFATHLPGIIKSVADIRNLNLSIENRANLNGIISYMESFECILMSAIWFKVLTAINYTNLVEVTNIKRLIDELKTLRDKWDSIMVESNLVANTLNISQELPEPRRKIRKRFADETPDEISLSNSENNFKQNVFYILLDCIIGNISRRYEAAYEIDETFNFLWKHNHYEEEEIRRRSKDFVNKYKDDVSMELIDELLHLKFIHDVNSKNDLDPFLLLNKINDLKLICLFPNICIGLRIFCTLPVTVAQAERSFSRLALIKHDLRSTMTQGRVSGLGILAMECDLAKKINFDSVIADLPVGKRGKF